MITTLQPMPELSPEQYAALREDINQRGILVPIVVDQHGRILDGHNRAAIGTELGIDVPREVREVDDDGDALDIAVSLNCARRHLTREQVRDVIAHELERRPGDSDRAIARRVACSPSTVGSVRRGPVSKLDSVAVAMTREEAEAATEEIKSAIENARASLYWLVGRALTNHITVPEVLGALTMARLQHDRRTDRIPQAVELWSNVVYDYVTEVTSWKETAELFPPHPDADPTPEERAWLIQSIVDMGLATGEHPADD